VAFGLIDAEELGVNSHDTDAALKSAKPEVRRLVGAEGGFGARLGVDDAFVLRAVKAVGNYDEIFERNLGTGSKLNIPRGLNQLWSAGGVMYAPPMR
jgi:general L-amino acid transport system substrate-binding protein